MRILNVTQSYAPFLEFGGPPVKVRALSEALARRGHQVTVLTADWGFAARSDPEIASTTTDRSPFGWRREENGVKAIYLPTWLRYRALSWNPALQRFLRARLGTFDVAHIFGLYDLLGPAVARACRRRSLPYVVEPIGMFLPIVRSLWLKRLYHCFLGQPMFQGCRFLIATSEQEQAELVSAGSTAQRIFLRRNGVDVPGRLPEKGRFRAAQGIAADAKLVLFLGRLSQKKSPELLLQAFAMLPESLRAACRLVFAGPDEGGMRSRLARMAVELGVTSWVQFLGPLFEQDKWAAYGDADIFVLPSQNENFGNTAAEAVAAGTPVIATETCGIAPWLAEVAGLVVPHNGPAISRAIERMLTESDLHARLAAGCKELAARLGWEEPALAMESLYGQLVEANSRVA
jgi:glycosyltransferase involved in cell wall biosynthesis